MMTTQVSKSEVSKKVRRSKPKQNDFEEIVVMYANIQGFTGKKTSLAHIIECTKTGVVLLAETMTRKVELKGCVSVCPSKSVGQNVAVLLSGDVCSYQKMKLYEPNETINMLGVRIVVKDVGIRLYTAHLKQQSAHTKDEIASQFDEIRNQFRSATIGREGMIILFDANVHVGHEGINRCSDKQDTGGEILMSLVKDEGLIIVNNMDLCKGVVTRVDPRYGTVSSIDLVICNTFMVEKLDEMVIDEEEQWKLKKYAKNVTKTDHHTIFVKLKVRKCVESIQKPDQIRYNLKNEDARCKMKQNIESDMSLDGLFVDADCDLDEEVEVFMKKWDENIAKSFHTVNPSKNRRAGVDTDVRDLLKKEKWIRKNVHDNVQKGREIAEVQKLISQKIAENLATEMETKVQDIIKSDNPQSKVFGVRRKVKKCSSLDFPLKDEHGVLQVSKVGIDQVISNHFVKVFAQNSVHHDQVWSEYWSVVDQVFNAIDKVSKDVYEVEREPTVDEIDVIIKGMNSSKANYGTLSIDLAKLCGKKISSLIHRCILLCFRKNVLPSLFREEKMTLLLKNKGVIDMIDDYRGIFLRHLILSVYQKWLYLKNSIIVDEAGSEYAFGGRKCRSGMDALLIVKLIQDYARWTKKEVVIEFLDVEKFFDSMNYQLGLIEAYRNGVTGRHWQSYKTINSSKKCVPHIPSGKCSPIDMENIFVQGSCDAVLVAWPMVDADSKREGDCFTTDFHIEGICINRMSFIDDLIGFNGSISVANESNLSYMVFERKTRLRFKVCKCKGMTMNCKRKGCLELNGEEVVVVKNHVYLGTIISSNGERFNDMNDRITKSNSVANEIDQICRTPELSNLRLWYVKLLMNSCLDGKVKYGSALWDVLRYKSSQEKLDKIKPSLLKRVLQVPSATPSVAIQYEFGVNDLAIDILLEKIVLAVETLKLDDNRLSKKILEAMLVKKVPGFCTEVIEACDIFHVSLDALKCRNNVREVLKKKAVELQSVQLLGRMMASSKTDRVLVSGFSFDGTIMKYLTELDFLEARAIFMARYRMWPTKTNYPGRWSGVRCNICDMVDTDEHIFSCPGYVDLINGEVQYEMFWNQDVLNDSVKLKSVAAIALKIVERLEVVQSLNL